jgi:hypothetical protein
MEEWLLMQTFYHGLTSSTHKTLDAADGGAFLSLNLRDAKALVEKMASNQSWNEEKALTHKRGGMNHLKEVDMLSAKMDLLIKKLEDQASDKKEVNFINEPCMTCEECEEVGHSGRNCPEFQEDVNYFNNNTNFRPQQNQGWNQQQRPNYSGNN